MDKHSQKIPLPKEWTSILKEARSILKEDRFDKNVIQKDRVVQLFPNLLHLIDLLKEEVNTLLSEKKKTNQSLKASQAQLVQSGKMAAIGQLAAGVSHEVNNPLQIILSRVQLLIMRHGKEEQLVKDLHLVESNVKRISQIISSLLDFASNNIEKETWKSIDLKNLVIHTSNLMLHLLEKAKIQLEFNFPNRPLSKIYGNVGEIEQVFLNLLINAHQAMPEGGRIDIKLLESKNLVITKICDTGEGISKENLPRIFEPFFTTRQNQGGTGLGLSIISSIVKKHNSAIEVESMQGKGTTFILYFPINRCD